MKDTFGAILTLYWTSTSAPWLKFIVDITMLRLLQHYHVVLIVESTIKLIFILVEEPKQRTVLVLKVPGSSFLTFANDFILLSRKGVLEKALIPIRVVCPSTYTTVTESQQRVHIHH